MHTFQPKDPIEVETEHGLGIVLFITVYGAHANDIWCVANKKDGKIRHYQTTQLKLAYSGVLEMNEESQAPANIEKPTGELKQKVSGVPMYGHTLS